MKTMNQYLYFSLPSFKICFGLKKKKNSKSCLRTNSRHHSVYLTPQTSPWCNFMFQILSNTTPQSPSEPSGKPPCGKVTLVTPWGPWAFQNHPKIRISTVPAWTVTFPLGDFHAVLAISVPFWLSYLTKSHLCAQLLHPHLTMKHAVHHDHDGCTI